MRLTEWLGKERGNAARLSEFLLVSKVTISQWKTGVRGIPLEHMPAIEKFTRGDVTRQDMYQDWAAHWPELAAKVKRRGAR